MRWLRRVIRAATVIDRAALDRGAAFRTGLSTAVLMLAAVAGDRLAAVVPAALGLLFVSIADPGGADRERMAVMGRTAVFTTFAVLAGTLAADPLPLHVTAAVTVAVACGLAGIIGPRSGFGGVLCLVLFVIFSGGPADFAVAIGDAVRYAAGGGIAMFVIGVITVSGRGRGPRETLARMLRGLANADPRDPMSLGAPIHAARERAFTVAGRADRAGTERAAWYAELAAGAHETRLGFLGLGTATGPDAIEFLGAAQAAARTAAIALLRPSRRGRLDAARRHLDETADRLVTSADPPLAAAVRAIRRGLDRVTTAAAQAPPRRRRPEPGHPIPGATPARTPGGTAAALHAHLRPDDPLTRHAVRLGLTIGVAIIVAEWLDLPHAYWLPLTVAWVSRPGLGETTVKVAARVLGTVLGIGIAAFVVEVLDPGAVGLALALAAAAAVAAGFLIAEYAIAVSGITAFVIFLFRILGQQVESAYPARLIATLLGGGIVLAAAFCWPTRSRDRCTASLADYAEALGAYLREVIGSPVVTDDRREHFRSRLLEARTRAAADLAAAEYELGSAALPVEHAREVLESLHLAVTRTLALELAGVGDHDRELTPELARSLGGIAGQLRRLGGETAETPTLPRGTPASPPPDHPVAEAILHAELALAAAGAHPH
ncbi:MAG: FUSC family protein [Actinomycetota bacterium]